MTAVRKLWPLLTATHHYEKTLSNRNRGAGTMIDAPILAYLIETTNGRVLYDFDGDYRWKIMGGEYDPLPGLRAISTPGHTAGHMSLFIESPKGPPVLLCGDAADLTENLEDEVAPGLCWRGQESMAVDSIRKLKSIAREEGARLWPNHDMAFWRSLRHFPLFHE